MKRIFLATVATLVVIVSASAQRLADVRAEATIITDKMIAELGIGPGYRNSILNINLAYLNSINSYRDIDAYGWERRNRETPIPLARTMAQILQHILLLPPHRLAEPRLRPPYI